MSFILNICGFPRSGTTLLAYKLNQLKKFSAVPEAQFRFHKKLAFNGNLIDKFRSKRRLKKSLIAWKQLAGKDIFSIDSIDDDFKNLSLNFLEFYHKNSFTHEVIIDHTPENIFGFDEMSDLSDQFFIFIERPIKSILNSHAKLSWSNAPQNLLVAKYSIYNLFIKKLKDYFDSINYFDYASIDYPNLIVNDWITKLKFPNKQSKLEKLISKNDYEIKSFPLPIYTKKQHSYLDKDMSEKFIPIEEKNKKLNLSLLRDSYKELTAIGILKSYFRK